MIVIVVVVVVVVVVFVVVAVVVVVVVVVFIVVDVVLTRLNILFREFLYLTNVTFKIFIDLLSNLFLTFECFTM